MADVIDSVENPELTIVDVMYRVLDQINATYSGYGVSIPTKQFLDMGGQGETPHDCEQVTVALEQVYNGLPGNPEQVPSQCAGPRSGVFIIEVVRCMPGMQTRSRGATTLMPPTADALTTVARTQATDAWLLMDAGLLAAQSLNYIGGLADVSFSPESGGYQATVLTLILGLP